MFDLTGKCALVTGASGGIGADIARTLHAAGATVGLSGTRVEPLEALAAELGDRAFSISCSIGISNIGRLANDADEIVVMTAGGTAAVTLERAGDSWTVASSSTV